MRADHLAKELGGRRVGGGWMARCPAHDDHNPSFSIREAPDGTLLFKCHAGCCQHDVIEALKSRGLWRGAWNRQLSHLAGRRAWRDRSEKDQVTRATAALAIWQKSGPAAGTIVQTYLRSRGLTLPPPPSLRFHMGLKHPSGGVWPAMVALVTNGVDGRAMGIHRTFLAQDGCGKAPVDPPKMMLGPCGGGVVRFREPGEALMIGEGIETCLAVMQARDLPAWTALSASGLRGLHLPPEVQNVIVLADADIAGEAAARECALRWKREGRRVRVARPPEGMDFNDVLVASALSIAEAS